MSKLSKFLKSSKRIFLISKKPTPKEYWIMARIVGLGVLIIGIIGFLVKLILKFVI